MEPNQEFNTKHLERFVKDRDVGSDLQLNFQDYFQIRRRIAVDVHTRTWVHIGRRILWFLKAF